MEEQVRVRIVESCMELFFKYGVRSITMDDIANKLGMSKKTIYQYFQNKEEIVRELVQHHVNEECNMCNAFPTQADNAIHEILLIEDYFTVMLSKMTPTLPLELSKYFPESWKLMDDFHKVHVLETIERNLQRGLAEGLYRSDMNIAIVARLRLQAIQQQLISDVIPVDKYSPVQVHKQSIMLFLHGVCNQQGLALLEQYKPQYALTQQ